MRCNRCGHENISSFRFCEVCLAPLRTDETGPVRAVRPEDVVGKFFEEADLLEQGSAEVSRGQITPSRYDLPWRPIERTLPMPIGRDAEIGHVCAAILAGLRERRHTAVTLQGEQGSGRSRVLAAVRERVLAELPGTRTLVISAQGCHRPYALLERLLRLRFDIGEFLAGTIAGERFERTVESFFGDSAGAEVARTCGPMLGFAFWNDHDIDFMDRGEQARRAREALFNLLQRVFMDPPTLLVVDDAGEADAESLAIFAQLVLDWPELPVAVIFATDRRGVVRRPWLGERPILELGSLSQGDMREVAKRALTGVQGIDDGLLRQLADLANGRPGMLLAALETLARAGGIVKDEGVWWLVADKARELLLGSELFGQRGGKLDGLSDFQVQVACRAAIFGIRAWAGGVVAMMRQGVGPKQSVRTVDELGRDPLPQQVVDALQVLVERGVLFPERQNTLAGEPVYRFLDEGERASLLELHVPGDLANLSQTAAVWLQMVGDDRAGDFAEVLAPLWLAAGDKVHAAHVYLRAGEQARDQYRNDAARQCLEKARELAPPELAHVHGEAALGLGRLHEFEGNWAEAERNYRDALELAWRYRARARGARALYYLGRMLRQQGKIVAAIDHLAPALKLYEAAQDLRGLAAACDDIGRSYWMAGRLDAAQQFLKRSVQYRERIGDRTGQAYTLTNLGIVLNSKGRIEQAKSYLERAVSLQRERKNLLGLVESLNALGVAHVGAGDIDAGVQAFEEALTLSKRIGNRRMLAMLQNNLGEVHCNQGRIDEGEALLYKAVEGAGRLGDHALLSDAARNLAIAARQRNDRERAVKWARRAVAAAASSDVKRAKASSQRTLADILVDAGDHSGAEEAFARAAEGFAQSGDVRDLQTTLQAHAAFLVRLGRADDAAPLLERADGADQLVPPAAVSA